MVAKTEGDSKTDGPDLESKASEYKVVETDDAAKDDATPAAAGRSYTVKDDDTLSGIAEDQLGDGNRWNEIYELNKDAIGDNPDVIQAGTKLTLPD